MPIDDRTTNRSYQLPNAENLLADDVARLRAALQTIDADIFARYTKAETDALINNLIAAAPGALNTLQELAAAMGNDPAFAATVTTLLGQKANIVDVYSKAQSDARYVQGQVQVEMLFIATANQSVFALSTPVINKPSALVSIDGVVQPTSGYSLNQDGTTLTLSEGVPAGTIVRVLALGVSSVGAPGDDTVTTPKLRDGAVTLEKLAAALQELLLPAGAVQYFAGATAPSGWLKADGSAINRTTYSRLWAWAQTSGNLAASEGAKKGGQFGPGNGSTTFTLPDLRGEFLRGWDDGRGADSNRTLGDFQDGTWTRQLMNDWSDVDLSGNSNFVGQAFAGEDALINTIPNGAKNGSGTTFGGAFNDNANISAFNNNTGVLGTWIQHRPRNIALLACIKH